MATLLFEGNFLETFSEELMEEAVQVAQNHELKLSARHQLVAIQARDFGEAHAPHCVSFRVLC